MIQSTEELKKQQATVTQIITKELLTKDMVKKRSCNYRETLTDNKNRTAGNEVISQRSGNIGTPGCISFMCSIEKSQIIIDKKM